jgi:hypothetical protein
MERNNERSMYSAYLLPFIQKRRYAPEYSKRTLKRKEKNMRLTQKVIFSDEIRNARISDKEKDLLFSLQKIILSAPLWRIHARGNPYQIYPELKKIDEHYVQNGSFAFCTLRDEIEFAHI